MILDYHQGLYRFIRNLVNAWSIFLLPLSNSGWLEHHFLNFSFAESVCANLISLIYCLFQSVGSG